MIIVKVSLGSDQLYSLGRLGGAEGPSKPPHAMLTRVGKEGTLPDAIAVYRAGGFAASTIQHILSGGGRVPSGCRPPDAHAGKRYLPLSAHAMVGSGGG